MRNHIKGDEQEAEEEEEEEDKGGQVVAIKREALRRHHQRLNIPASSNCEVFTVNQGQIEAGSRGRGCAAVGKRQSS